MHTNVTLGLLLAMLTTGAAMEVIPTFRARGVAAPLLPTPAALTPFVTPSAEPSGGYIDTIMTRPLFTEGRRPAATATAAAAAATVEKPPRLSGILVTGNDRRAIFESSGKPIVGTVGTQMGSYRILAITPLRVTLQGPDGTLAMSLSYGANGAITPVPTPNLIDDLNSGTRPPLGMPKTPTFQEMMANLPKTLPPMLNGIPQNDTRPAR